MDQITIGIDGGGSGCRVAVARNGGRIAETTGGPANIFTDMDAALANVALALDTAMAQLMPDEAAHAAICAGLAGGRAPGCADRFAKAFPRLIRVLDDSETTLTGALGTGDGVVASLGTGSFFASQSDGTRRVIGGWGFVLGDEGSAAWLGREALRLALHARDGRSPPDDLTDAILSAVDQQGGPLPFAAIARPADYADLARLVLHHADAPTANGLIDRTVAHVTDGIADAGHQPGTPLVLMGSLGQALAPLLPDALQGDLKPPLGTALDGALALAAHP